MKKLLKYTFIIALLVGGYFTYTTYPKLDIISGFAAKSVASHYFIAGRKKFQTEAEDNKEPTMGMANALLLEDENAAKADAFGLKKRWAIYREGVGVVLLPSDKKREEVSNAKPKRNLTPINFPYPFGNLPEKDTIFKNVDYPALQSKVAKSFTDTEENEQKTRSVIVIYKDHIIDEHYKDGFNKNSMILGWSMAKSITSAVLGALEKEGKVSLNQTHLFKEWENDERKDITLANLLNMNSGLEWEENYTKICDVTEMLFIDSDMTKSQLIKPLTGIPNESWNYSSGTSNLLSGFIRNQFNSQQEYLDYWYSELIDKIGMHSMIIETDFQDNYIGSSYVWATTRDWAKFGLLYLHNGNWNGEQILNQSWIDFTKKPTNGSNGVYGGHFWMNAGGKYPDVPKDMFSCNGFQGQRVYIIPSKDLVVVRTGIKGELNFDVNEFLSGIISTIKY